MDITMIAVAGVFGVIALALSYYFGWPLMKTLKKMNEYVNVVRGGNVEHSLKSNIHWIDERIEEQLGPKKKPKKDETIEEEE